MFFEVDIGENNETGSDIIGGDVRISVFGEDFTESNDGEDDESPALDPIMCAKLTSIAFIDSTELKLLMSPLEGLFSDSKKLLDGRSMLKGSRIPDIGSSGGEYDPTTVPLFSDS